jgi:hypothetical protein
MALHDDSASMVSESYPEILEAARHCISYRKDDKEKWKEFATGGCLGLIDSMGSYHRGNNNFKINIDGKQVSINAEGWEHFKILNSKYFNQNLSEEFIKVLYESFRNKLIHNSKLKLNAVLIPNNESQPHLKVSGKAFLIAEQYATPVTPSGNTLIQLPQKIYIVSLMELLYLCSKAVEQFKNDMSDVIPKSKQGKNFN